METVRVLVYKFTIGDIEDPELYAAKPLYEWQNTESGKWILEHAVDRPIWHRHTDHNTYSYTYGVTAILKSEDYTYWKLRF